MVKKNKKEVVSDIPIDVDFAFFKKQLKDESISLESAMDITNPTENRTGSISLDHDLSIPFPAGKITEIFGAEGSCKTTLALEAAAQAVLAGKIVLYINMERNLTRSLMETVRTLRPFIDQAIEEKGENNPDCPLWIAKAPNGDVAFDMMQKFAEMVPNGVAILDSIDAAVPASVMSESIGAVNMGKLAKLLSDAMRKIIVPAEENNVALIFINQIRDTMSPYGNPEDTPGGRALKFYSTQRVKLMKPGKAQSIMNVNGDKIGVLVRYKIIKNKVAPDGNEGQFPILYNNGIFREQEIISHCLNFGVLRFGGRGGKQVLMPVLDRDTGEFKVDENGDNESYAMKQFDAARRLLLDITLREKLEKSLLAILDSDNQHAADELLIDEVQES